MVGRLPQPYALVPAAVVNYDGGVEQLRLDTRDAAQGGPGDVEVTRHALMEACDGMDDLACPGLGPHGDPQRQVVVTHADHDVLTPREPSTDDRPDALVDG
nr:hypothetical protein [Saccharomonospora marina]